MFKRLQDRQKTESLRRQERHAVASKEAGISRIGVALALGVALSLVALAANPFGSGGGASTRAQASGGDFKLDLVAAAPQTYNHQTTPAVELLPGSLQYDARSIGDPV